MLFAMFCFVLLYSIHSFLKEVLKHLNHDIEPLQLLNHNYKNDYLIQCWKSLDILGGGIDYIRQAS